MTTIIIIQILAHILMFFCGFKIGKILARKKFVEFLMNGIEENIKENLQKKIDNDEPIDKD